MKLTQTNPGRLKACGKLARGKAESRRPWSASGLISALKGRRNGSLMISSAPSGREHLTAFSRGIASLNPGLISSNPSGCSDNFPSARAAGVN
jgi:hypothetical protein